MSLSTPYLLVVLLQLRCFCPIVLQQQRLDMLNGVAGLPDACINRCDVNYCLDATARHRNRT